MKLFVPKPDAGIVSSDDEQYAGVDASDDEQVDANGSGAGDDVQGQEFDVAAELLKQSSPVFASMLVEKTWKESSANRIHLTICHVGCQNLKEKF